MSVIRAEARVNGLPILLLDRVIVCDAPDCRGWMIRLFGAETEQEAIEKHNLEDGEEYGVWVGLGPADEHAAHRYHLCDNHKHMTLAELEDALNEAGQERRRKQMAEAYIDSDPTTGFQ